MEGEHGGEVLYTITDVARMLQLNAQTVRRYCRDGTVAAIKLGTHWRIPASALTALLEDHPHNEGELDNGFQRFRVS